MVITLPQPNRFALKWLAAWRVMRQEKREPLAEDFDTSQGILALALEVPGSTPPTYYPRRRGRPVGHKKTRGISFYIPNRAQDPLARLAGVYGAPSPQDVVQLFAAEILRAAPHVELDCSAAENFAAIDGVIAAMHLRCVEAAVEAAALLPPLPPPPPPAWKTAPTPPPGTRRKYPAPLGSAQ